MRIIVLAGGLSSERDVSLSSGSLIANALIKNGHDVMLLDLYLGINNPYFKPIYYNKETNQVFKYEIKEEDPKLDDLKKEYGEAEIGDSVIDLCKEADLVFLALHGGIGENGSLQKIFDDIGIKYTGSSSLASKVAMDKRLSKLKVKDVSLVAKEYDLNNISYPCVIKPNNDGSSCGVSIIHRYEDLENAINYAKAYDSDIIIEEYIKGREFSVGILGEKALPSIEIIPKESFYNYENKYQEGKTIEVCPSDIDPFLEEKLRKTALLCHKALSLGYYSRIDFIVDDNNSVYFLEANTLPGMTPFSLLPKEALEVGISYEKLCEMIVESAKK